MAIDWPDTGSLVMPRNAEGAAPDPVLDALAEFAAPWQLMHFAHALRAAGMNIPTRAEPEYAAAAHWLIGHALRSGANWRDAAIADLAARQEAVLAAKAED